jgi:hypothetical protein
MQSKILSKTPLLITESENDFAELKKALTRELQPRSIIEQIYVTDIATIVWDVSRLRRCKVAIVNMAFRDALSNLLYRLLGHDPAHRQIIEKAPGDWFLNRKVRSEVSELLENFHLDQSAIEAEAIRSKFSELEMLDRMLTLHEARFNRTLRSIHDYQDKFGSKVRQAANRLFESDPVIRLDPPAKRSA